MKHYSGDGFLNVGTGEDIAIADFARLVAKVVGYRGEIAFDRSRPDGTPRKLLDLSKLAALGRRAKAPLREGRRSATDRPTRWRTAGSGSGLPQWVSNWTPRVWPLNSRNDRTFARPAATAR